MKALSALPILAFSLLLANCGGGGGSATPSVLPKQITQAAPAPTATPIVYAALGDSITLGGAASSPATDYVSLVGAALNATTTDLGIGGETSGPISQLVSGSLISYPGVLAAEVPNIPLNANLVTLYIGTNDIFFAENDGLLPDFSNFAGIANATVAIYTENVQAIVAGIRARVPNARIIVASVPTSAYRSINQYAPALDIDGVLTMGIGFRNALIALGLDVVDFACDPVLYADSTYSDPYNVHPDDAGHAAMAADLLAQITNPTSPGTCKYVQYP